MITNFNNLEFIDKTEIENMRGGNGVITLYKVKEKPDNLKLLMKIVIPPKASIGYHEHIDDTEVMYIVDGVATINDNDVTYNVEKDNIHICFKNNKHSVTNNTNKNLIIIACIVKEN